MAKSDINRLQVNDIAEAIGLITRLPVSASGERGVDSAWAWPIAGVLVALIAAIVGLVALALGLSDGFAAALILTVMVVTTGAMHEDGLADCADGFWGGWQPARRLEIMKDSRIGTYGVVALVLSLLARWLLINTLIGADWVAAPLLAAAALSRVPMVGLMHWLPSARKGGLSDGTGVPDQNVLVLAGGVGLLLGLILGGYATLLVTAALVAVTFGFGKLAMAKIGGQTGDVLGASQQLAEITALAIFVAVAV